MGRRSPPRAPPPRLIKAIFSVWKRLINSVWKIGRRPHRCPNTRVIPKSNRQNCVGTFFLFDHPICVFVALYDLIFSAWPRGNFHNAIDRSIPSWNWANWMMMIFFLRMKKCLRWLTCAWSADWWIVDSKVHFSEGFPTFETWDLYNTIRSFSIRAFPTESLLWNLTMLVRQELLTRIPLRGFWSEVPSRALRGL